MQPLDIWPENWPALLVYDAMRTQWSVGMAGAIGLRYEALPLALEMQGIARADWPDTIAGVRAMEAETLRLLRAR